MSLENQKAIDRGKGSGRDLLKAGERLDDLQIRGYEIIQHPKKFCFGMDAVLLSGFARVKPGERVMDLCTGTGVLPILLEAKTAGCHFTGLEIQPESADMARRSVAYNALEDRIDIVTGDIRDASNMFGASSFDVVTCNPPYIAGRRGLLNPEDAMAIARHELFCSLEDVVRETARLLPPKGRCYFVHRPSRLVEIFSLMHAYHLEPKRMRLVYPFSDREPNMVLVEGLRDGKPNLIVERPLIIYEKPGVYTRDVLSVYEHRETEE